MAAQSSASKTADSSIAIGTLVGGRFEVEREEASDPLGRLLLARDQKTKKPIAVFVLAESLAADRAAVEIFRSEARSAAKLKHRNLVAIYGVGTHAGREHFIAHEWMAGQTAAQLIAARTPETPLSVRGVYNLVTHVCKALTAIHELTLHGALRPRTVWLSKSGRVKLGELGVAAVLAKTLCWQQLPPDEQAYIAPEIRAGAAPSRRSDVFGVGALLYSLLTSRAPSDAFVAPSQVRSDATAELDAVVSRCLASDPDQRFSTADEIVQALLPLCAEAPEPSRPDFEVDVEVDVDVAHSSRPGAIVRRSMPVPSSLPPIDVAIGQTLAPSPAEDGSLPELLSLVPVTPPVSPPPPSAAGARRPGQGRTPANAQGLPLAAPPATKPAGPAKTDLTALTARLTQNDAPRWIAVKNEMDHGPFTARELIKMIVGGEVLEEHLLFTLSSTERKPLGAYPEFAPFVHQYKLRKEERDHARALEHSKKAEKRSTAAKALILSASIGLIIVVGVGYFLSRRAADARVHKAELDLAALYESGQVKISGTAGILKHTPRPGGARRSGAPQTGGGFSSYEDAMNQAMELGDATKGGSERQLTSNDVAGIMNRNLNRMFTCVGDELRHGAKLSRVTIDVAILGSGRVMGASVNAGSAGFQKCIAAKVRELQFPSFPAPRMGARYSFNVD